MILDLSDERAEYFLLCEKNRKHIDKLISEKVFELRSGDAIISFDDGGNLCNIKRILNKHFAVDKRP